MSQQPQSSRQTPRGFTELVAVLLLLGFVVLLLVGLLTDKRDVLSGAVACGVAFALVFPQTDRWDKPSLKNWWVMVKPLAFVVGVPSGIVLALFVGALLKVDGQANSTAKGILWGTVGGVVIGGILGGWGAATSYRWTSVTLLLNGTDWETDWRTVIRKLNVEAAREHYLLARDENEHAVYAPTLVRPVAAGPLTISGEYLSVAVALSSESTITITGPKYMVAAFKEAAGLSEQDAHADP